MGVLLQFGLLLQRYLIIRKRQPVILLLEVLWPLLIFLVVAVVRQGAPPNTSPNCHYKERAMPNAGMLPFVQSFVCNLNNECHDKDGKGTAEANMQRFSSLIGGLAPHLSNPRTLEALKSLDDAKVLLDTLSKNLNNDSAGLLDYVRNGIPVRDLFRDPDEIRRVIVEQQGAMPGAVLDAIMAASIDVNKLTDILDSFDMTGIVCNATRLQQYLIFDETVDVKSVSYSLCAINDTLLPGMVDLFQRQLDIVKIIKMLSNIQGSLGDYGLADGFNDLSLLLDLVLHTPALQPFLKNLPELFDLKDIIRQIPDWIDKIMDLSKNTWIFREIANELDPFISGLSKNSSVWKDIKEGIFYADEILNMFSQITNPSAGVPFRDFFTGASQAESVLRNSLSEETVSEIMKLEVKLDKVTPYVTKSRGEDYLSLFCDNQGGAAFVGAVGTDAQRGLESFLCRPSGGNKKDQLLALIDPKSIQASVIHARLKALSPFTFDIATMMEKGLAYIERITNMPPEIMGILRSLSGIRLESSLNTILQLFNGSTNVADTIKMMTWYLNDLDDLLSKLPSGNATRVLMAITETSLDTLRQAVDTLTGFDEYVETLLRDDFHVLASVNELLALGPPATKAVLTAFTDPKKLTVLLDETSDVQGLFCNQSQLSEFLNVPMSRDLEQIQDILCRTNVSMIVREAMQHLQLPQLEAMFTNALNDIEGYVKGLKPASKRFNLTSIVAKSEALINSATKAFHRISKTWEDLFQGISKINMNGTEWKDVWPQSSSGVWTGSVAVLIEKWGPAMEKSDLWPMVGPYIRVADIIMQRVVYQMNSMTAISSTDSTFGRLMNYLVEYGPDMLEALLSIVDNPRLVTEIITSDGLSSVLCDVQKVRSIMTIPDDIPLEEILQFMCGIDYNQLFYEMYSLYDMTATVQQVSMLLNRTLGLGAAPGFDWSMLIRHGKDMVMSFENPTSFTRVNDMWKRFDLAKLGKVFNDLWNHLIHMTPENSGRFFAFGLSFGHELDTALSNVTIWRVAKYYIQMYDLFFERLNMNLQKGNGLSFNFKDFYPNATTLNGYLEEFGEAVPDFIEAVKNIIIHPYKLSRGLMQAEFENKTICNGIKITELLDLQNAENLDRLEESLCQFKWPVVMQELTQDPAIKEVIVALQNYTLNLPVENIMLNWTKLIMDVSSYFENLYVAENESAPMIEFPGLNMTAVDISFKDLVNMATTYYTDPSRAQALSGELGILLEELAAKDKTVGSFWKMQKIYMYIVNQFLMVANNNLPRLQHGRVNLVDFLHSEELDKIVKSIKASPEIVQLLLDTIVDILTDPAKAAKFSDPNQLMQVCSHQATFDSLFPEAARSQIDLQGTICNASMVNITKMVSELQDSVLGLRQMIHAVTDALRPGYPTEILNVNYTSFIKNYDQFIQILTEMITTPPQIDLGLGTRWMNETIWQDILSTFGERFQTAFQRLQSMSFGDLYRMMIPMIEQQLLPYKDMPEFKESIRIVDDTLKQAITALEQLLAHNATSLQAFLVDYPTLEKIFELSNKLPQLLATVTYSNSFNPQSINMVVNAIVTSWESFCVLDITRYMTPVPGLTFDIRAFQSDLCGINITTLRQEVEAFTGTTILMSNEPIGSNIVANVTAMLLDLGKLFDIYIGMIEHPPMSLIEVFDWLNGTVWNMSFKSVGKSYADPATIMRMIQSLDEVTPLLDNLTQTDSFWGYMWKIQKEYMYIMNQFLIMVNQNLPRFNGKVDLLDFFRSRELEKVAAALEASPEIVKVLFDSILDIMEDPSKSSKFSDPQLMTQICSTPTSFRILFPDSLTSRVDLQGVICNMSMINTTKLVAEMQDGVYGLSQMIQNIVKAMNPNTTMADLNVNFTSTMKNYDLFMALLTNLTISPPQIDLGFGQDWVNASQWAHLWSDFGQRLTNITQSMQATGLVEMTKNMLPYLEMQFQPLYQIEGFNVTLFYIDMYATNALQTLKLMEASSPAEFNERLKDFPNMVKMFRMTDEIPKLLATLLYPKAMFTAKDNVEAFTSVASMDDFCRLNMSLIFPGFPDNAFNPETFKEQLCQINITALSEELQLFGGGSQLRWETTYEEFRYMRTINGTNSTISTNSSIATMRPVFNVSVSQTIMTVMNLIQAYERTIQRPTDVARVFAMFNGTVWDQWFSKLDRQYTDLGALGRLRDLAMSIRPTVQLLIESKPIRDQLSPSMLRGLDGLVNYLTNFINMLKVGKIPNLWDQYLKLPFFQNVFKLMNDAPDIVDVVMETLMKPKKSQIFLGLVANPTSSLGTFCNLTKFELTVIFVKPVNSSVNLTDVQALICSLDFAGLTEQMNNITMNEYGFAFDIFQRPSNGTDNFNMADFLKSIDSMQDRLLNISFRPPDSSLFDQNNVNSYLPFLKFFSGHTWAPLFDKISAKLTSDPASFLDIMMSLQPVLAQLLQNPESVAILHGVDQALVYLTGYFQTLQEGKIINPLDMFNGAPNFQNILGLFDELPEIVEILIETMLNPLKTQTFISLFAVPPGLAFQTFCNITDLGMYLEKPINSTVDLYAVRDTICRTKYDQIPLEINNATLDNYRFLYQMIFPQFYPPTGALDVNDTVAQFYQHLQTFQEAFNNLTLHPPGGTMFQNTKLSDFLPFLRWFDGERWSQMFSRVGHRLTDQGVYASRLEALSVQMGPILASIPMDKAQLITFQVMTTYINAILEKLDDIDGKTTIRLADLFPNSPNIQALANLLDQNPEVIEMLVYSSNQPKFTRLYSMNTEQALTSICTSPVDTYFTVPAGSNPDLTRIVGAFCAINITTLTEEFLSELRIPQIQSELTSNVTTFNFSVYFMESRRLEGYIEKWIRTPPPQLVVSEKWTNDSYWLDWLSDYGQYYANDPVKPVYQILEIYALLPILPVDNPAFRQIWVAMEEVTRIVKEKLNEYAGRNLTLEILLEDAPRVKRVVLEALDITPDLLDTLFTISIKDPRKVVEVFSSGNWKAMMCAGQDSLKTLFKMPDSINASEVQQLICSINETLLSADFMNLFGINEMLTKLHAIQMGNVTIDWVNIFRESQGLGRAIDNLIRNPPNFQMPRVDVAGIQAVVQRFMTNFQDQNGLMNLLQVFGALDTYLKGTESWDVVHNYLVASEIIQRYMNDMLSKIMQNGRNIDLAQIFGNSPRVRNLLDLAFHLGPDFVSGFLSATIKPDMSVNLAAGSLDLDQVFCSETEMRKYFIFHPSFNLTYAVSALCHFNTSQILQELMKEFNIQTLADQLVQLENGSVSFDLRDYIQQSNELVQNVMKLLNSTGVTFGKVDVVKYFKFNGSVNDLLMNTYSMAISPNMTSYATQLQMLMPMLERSDFWKYIQPVLNAVNIMADVFNKKLTTIETSPITLENLVKNATYFRNFMEEVFRFGPDILNVFMGSSINPAVMVMDLPVYPNFTAFTPEDWLNYTFPPLPTMGIFAPNFCIIDIYTNIPSEVNLTAVREIVCKVNTSIFIQELKREVNYDKIFAEFMKVSQNSSEPFDWTAFLVNIQTLVEKIGYLPHANISIPSFPAFLAEFFNFDGNMNEWLARLEQAVNLDPTNKRVDSLAILKMSLHGLITSAEGWLEQTSTLPASLNKVMSAVGQLLTLVQHQILSIPTDKQVDLMELFRSHAPYINALDLFNGTSSPLVQEFVNLKFKTQKLIELATSPDRKSILCTNTSWSDLFYLPDTPDTGLTDLMAMVFCSPTAGYQQTVFDAIAGYSDTTRVLENLLRVIGKSTDQSYNSTQVADTFNRLLDLILVRPPGRGEQLSPALVKLLDMWSLQIPTINAKLYEAGMKLFISLVDQSSDQFDGDWSRVAATTTVLMDITSSWLHRITGDGVGLRELFTDNTPLWDLIQSSLQMNRGFTDALFSGHIRLDKLLPLISQTNGAQELCQIDTFNEVFSLPVDFKVDNKDLRAILCQNGSQLLHILGSILNVNIGNLMAQLSRIWDPMIQPPTVDYYDIYLKSDTLVKLMADIVSNPRSTEDMMLDYVTGMMGNTSSILDKLATGDPQIWSNLVRTVSQSLGDIFDSNHYLYPIFQWIDGSVFQQITNQMKMFQELLSSNSTNGLGAFLNLGNLAKEQLDALSSINIVKDEVCRVSWFETYYASQPFINATAISAAMCNQPPSVWYDNLVQARLGSMDILTLAYMLQSQFFMEAFSSPQKNPALSTLDWQGFTSHLQGMLNQMGIPLPGLDGTNGNNILGQLGSGSLDALISTLDILRFIDPMINSAAWDSGKPYVQLFSEIFGITNKLLDRLTVTNSTLKLINLYPDPNELKIVLESAYNSVHSAELMTASVRPFELLSLVQDGDLMSVACDPVKFNKTFVFGEHINSTAVMMSLCEAAKANATYMDKVVNLLDLKSIIQEISRVSKNWETHTVMNGRDLWDYAKVQVEHFKENLEKLQQISSVDSGIMGWATTLGNVMKTFIATDPQVFSQTCDSLLPLFSTSYYEDTLKPILTKVMAAFKLARNQLKVTVNFESIVCDLPGKNLSEVIKQLGNIHLFDLIEQFIGIYAGTSAPVPFDCGELGQIIMEMSLSNTSLAMMVNPKYNETAHCMYDMLYQDAKAVTDIDSVFRVLNDVLLALEDKNVLKLTSTLSVLSEGFKPVLPSIQLFLRAILGQQQVVTTLATITNNQTSVADYLVNILQVSPDIVNALFQSTLSLDIANLFNGSAESIGEVFCDASQLGRYLSLPAGFSLSLSTVSEKLCGPNLTEAINYIQTTIDLGKIALQLSQIRTGNLDTAWFRGLAVHVSDLMTKVQGLTKLLDFNLDNVDYDSALPELQKFLKNNGPEAVIDSLELIIEDFRAINNGTVTNVVIDVLKTTARGLLGLDIIKLLIIPDIGDLLLHPEEVRRYMIEDLGFAPEVADSILKAEVSVSVNLRTQKISDFVCEPKSLSELILLDPKQAAESHVTIEDISTALCAMDTDTLANFTSTVLRGMDLKDLLDKFLTYSADGLLAGSGFDLDEAEVILKDLEDAQDDLFKASEKFKNIIEEFDLKNLLPTPEALQSGDSLASISELLCGKSVSVRDQFGLSGASNDGSHADSEEDNFSPSQWEEINYYSNPYCKDMLKTMFRSSGGSIIWAYMKPLLVGKIVFTPNTDEIREIIRISNGTFRQVAELHDIAMKWVNGADDLRDFVASAGQYADIKDLLSSSVVSDIIQRSFGVTGRSISESLDQLNSLKPEQIDQLKAVAGLVANYSTCLELDRWEGFDTVDEVFTRAQQLQKKRKLMAAVEFLVPGDEVTKERKRRQANTKNVTVPKIPKNIIYKIRMDIDNVPITTFNKDRIWRPIPEDNFASDMRYFRGFLQLQEMLDNAIIRLHTGENGPPIPSIYTQQFPFPCHQNDLFLHVLSFYLLPIMMTLAWVGSLGMAIKILMYDRENGLEETLKVMGMKSGVNWLAWFSITLFFMILISILEVVILKVSTVFRFSNWLILILYLVDFALSSILMCYMVSAFFTRANMAALTSLIIYMISYLPFVLMTVLEAELTFTQKMLGCLSSTTAFGFASQYLSRYEEQLVGVQWSNIDKSPITGDQMNIAWAGIMMLVDAAIYLIIGWYVRNIVPRKYGMRQPWYFLVSPSYWGCTKGNSKSSDKYIKAQAKRNGIALDSEKPPVVFDAINLNMLIEPAGGHSNEVGIGLVNLTKRYKGDHPAVDELSVDFYKGQITSLLGHNGAGKTTAINMLIGVVEPTHGTALVNGRSIHTSLTKIRRDVGICPQHNTLFDYMTVKEHLQFYIGLKNNFTGKSMKEEIERMLHSVDLVDERDVPAGQLSGGMKRRLCVALAFAGGASTIILDEPTSGVDPNARRRIWDVILHNRHNRTILLSTHHLDEADILSDRIAILNEGKLLCCGSSMFLKDHLGSGYHLTVSKDAEASSSSEPESARDSLGSDTAANILEFVRKTIPRAEIEEEVGTEVKYTLPMSDGQRGNFHGLFIDIDNNMDNLGIVSYGVSETTLEEVFLKACYLADAGKPFTPENLKEWNKRNLVNGNSDKASSRGSENELTTLVKSPEQKKRSSGFGQQFSALWLKRFHHYRRDWRLLLTLLLLPTVFIAMGMGFTIVQKELEFNPPIVLTPSMYGDGIFSFLKQNQHNDVFDAMSQVLRSKPGLGSTCMAEMRKWPYISDEFDCESNPDGDYQAHNNNHFTRNISCRCDDYRYTCKGEAYRPPQMKTMTTDILQDFDNIADINQHLLDSFFSFTEKRYGGWTFEETDGSNGIEYKVKVWFNNKGYHAIPAYVNTISNTILRSRLDPSLSPEEYGITAITHPYKLSENQIDEDALLQKAGDTGIALVILMAFSFIPATFIIYNINERIKKEKRLQYISGVNAFTYWFVAYIWDMMIFAVTVGLFVAIAAMFQVNLYWANMNLYAEVVLLLIYGSAVTCMMYMTNRWFSSSTTAYMTLFCLNMLLGIMMTFTLFILSFFKFHPVINQVHTILQYIFMVFPQFCLGEGLIRITTNQMISELFANFGEDVYKDPFSFEMLGWLYVAMGIETVVFFIITLLSDIDTRPVFRNKKPREDVLEDDDVKSERNRVEHGAAKTDVVMALNLSKLYMRGLKKVVAVDNISFGVRKGECFGLLGVNGAGKTTTFKMLTADVQPSVGDAYLKGKSIRKLTAQLRRCMGYCPQDDALDDFLTGREMLQCHGRLKGMSSKDIKQTIDTISTCLDMTSLLDKTTRAYSGGMRRKLSVAIAILGNPDIVYLDEPTTGMDPVNRRLVWNVISDLVKAGQSLILTSHSMAECDALCTRLAIMVNGHFTCMGSPQHLKHKFSEGYTVILKVRDPANNGHHVSEFMYATFPGSQFKDQHYSTIEFTIPVESAKVALIFGHLERHKDHLGIQDYSVQQTTLDSVFIHFAKRQTDGMVESPEGSVTETDVETSKGTLTKSDLSLSGPFVNQTYAYMNPRVNLDGDIELQSKADSGYFAPNLKENMSRHSSQKSETVKVNPLAHLEDREESEYVTHL